MVVALVVAAWTKMSAFRSECCGESDSRGVDALRVSTRQVRPWMVYLLATGGVVERVAERGLVTHLKSLFVATSACNCSPKARLDPSGAHMRWSTWIATCFA